MNDQPELSYTEESGSLFSHTNGGITPHMTKDQLLLALLEQLLGYWLTETSVQEIGNDPEKIRLLRAVRENAPDAIPSRQMRTIYQEVFFRDLWANNEQGGASRKAPE